MADVLIKTREVKADSTGPHPGLKRPDYLALADCYNNGALNIERADKLVQLVAGQIGMNHPILDQIVALVDRRLDTNRKSKHAAA